MTMTSADSKRSEAKGHSADDSSAQPAPDAIREDASADTVSSSKGTASRSDPSTPHDDRSLPEHFGRYRVEKRLGEGAMGTVYLAHDTQLERKVALKVPKLSVTEDATVLERFRREARVAANLRSEHICPVYDVGKLDGFHYIAMAYIEGQPLSGRLASEPLSNRALAHLVRKVAVALNKAHGAGVVHRDLKPGNIMLDRDGEPVLMDFGLARPICAGSDTRLTQSGAILGSPAYMSPEQVEGHSEQIGPATDIYSLGVILFELLTGRVPFSGSMASVLGKIAVAAFPKPSEVRPDVDPRLEAICLKMTARKIEDRYGSMNEVVAAMDAYLGGEADTAVVAASTLPPTETTATPIAQTLRIDELAKQDLQQHARSLGADDLSTLIANTGPLPLLTAVDCILHTARAIETAHEQGVTHGSINPTMLHLDKSGSVSIVGLEATTPNAATAQLTSPTLRDLSNAEADLFLADYIAPEQALNPANVDPRSDVYSLGCLLYFLLTGTPMYAGETLLEKLVAHREQPVPSLRAQRDDVPADLDAVFRRMVAKSLDERYTSMNDAVADLQACRTKFGSRWIMQTLAARRKPR